MLSQDESVLDIFEVTFSDMFPQHLDLLDIRIAHSGKF